MCNGITELTLSNIKLGTTTDHPAGHTDSPSPASRMPRRTQEETPGRSEVSPHPPGAWPSQGWGRSPGNIRTCIESKANPSNPEGTDNVSCCSKGPGAPTKRRQAHPRGCRAAGRAATDHAPPEWRADGSGWFAACPAARQCRPAQALGGCTHEIEHVKRLFKCAGAFIHGRMLLGDIPGNGTVVGLRMRACHRPTWYVQQLWNRRGARSGVDLRIRKSPQAGQTHAQARTSRLTAPESRESR